MAEKGKWMRVFAKKNLFEKLVPEHSVTVIRKMKGCMKFTHICNFSSLVASALGGEFLINLEA